MLLCMLSYMCRGVCGLLQSLQWCSSVCCKSWVSSVASQCWADSTKFLQWCSSVPCKYSLGRPVVFQCTLGQPVAFQWHSSVHWTSQCTLAQDKGSAVNSPRRSFRSGSFLSHDDVIRWKHFPRYCPFVRGIRQSPVNFPHKGQWRGSLMFSLICAWINAWINNREAGDLTRHHACNDTSHTQPKNTSGQKPTYMQECWSHVSVIQAVYDRVRIIDLASWNSNYISWMHSNWLDRLDISTPIVDHCNKGICNEIT